MTTITTNGGAEIYHEDWYSGQAVIFTATWHTGRISHCTSGSWKAGPELS